MAGRRPWEAGRSVWLGFAAVALAALAPLPAAAEDGAVEQIIAVLHEKGLIDDAQQTQILARHVAQRASAPAVPGFLQGLEVSGDFRLRWEGFFFDGDARGIERSNRSRVPYRLRIGLRKPLTDSLAVGLRLASGPSNVSGSPRSVNQSLGESPDFDSDPIRLDRAYLELALPKTSFGLVSRLEAGKTGNPFLWDRTPDFLVWDSDLQLEGGALRTSLDVNESLRLFGNAAVYVAEERDSDADPKVFGAQLGASARLTESLEVGLRVSGYEWRSLEEPAMPTTPTFIQRSMTGGNLIGAFDSRARLGESTVYLKVSALADWPVMLWASQVINFTADPTIVGGIRAGEENDAFGFGIEAGDPTRFIRAGIGFFHVEANSVLGQFTDADPLDGRTNGEGFTFYLTRILRPGVQLRLVYYDSDSLRSRGGTAGPFAASIANRDRKRVQTDLVLSF